MRSIIIAMLLAHTGCQQSTECGEGTIERNGNCEPADVTVDDAKCGENTQVVGDRCVPVFAPTTCDPSTTDKDLDPSSNVTTCIGKAGGGGCGAPIACPQPSAGQQTICGQLYDLENDELFVSATATGTRCDAANPTATGPCALRITPYDAVAFAMNPAAATPLATVDTYIDDCGRYRLTDVTPPAASPFIALGLDDRDMTKVGPMGVTNAAGTATATAPGTATKDLEAFIVNVATTTKWQQTGGPSIAGGIYAMIFRQKRAPSRLTQAGVTMIKGTPPNLMPAPATDSYFVNTDVQRERVDGALNATGANGTALVTNAALTDGVFSGAPTGLPAECRWSLHPAQTVAGVVFVQILRPVNATGMTCNL